MLTFGTLSEHLIATLYPVNRKGVPQGDGKVFAMVSEASLEASMAWQSPFEAMGPEAVSPALMAMVQAGGFSDLAGTIGDFVGGVLGETVSTILSAGQDAIETAQGRTGLTKMNSTQVFTGAPPIKISMTLLFRAWSNPREEVETPVDTLMGWSLPQCLADNLVAGATATPCSSTGDGLSGLVGKVLPSLTPQMVGLTYKNRTYAPLVIESIGIPLDSPVNPEGQYIELSIPLTLASLQAWDVKDWNRISGRPFSL